MDDEVTSQWEVIWMESDGIGWKVFQVLVGRCWCAPEAFDALLASSKGIEEEKAPFHGVPAAKRSRFVGDLEPNLVIQNLQIPIDQAVFHGIIVMTQLSWCVWSLNNHDCAQLIG